MNGPEPSGVCLKALAAVKALREIQPFVALPERRRELERVAAELDTELRGES